MTVDSRDPGDQEGNVASDQSESRPREWFVKRNKYGGYEVVGQDGRKAPNPSGFNSREGADRRAAELNYAEGRKAAGG